ncbi:uncharacterized protein LOC106472550 [Limulus polyphemus]|uniref:Uncharacterized protein LOC106472550 n=1 Tax=Limulus polyphemus TaxID=6850 RepID=A0ABM1BU25_LIMPO|nr:uncharacterized protein LOC106472550 [Limulus polyphemus]
MAIWRIVQILVFITVAKGIPVPEDENIQEAVQRHVRSTLMADFDKWAKEYVNQQAREKNRKVSWWDLYGNHQHLKERPEYHRYKIEVRAGDVQYSTVTRQVDRPQSVYTKWYHNDQAKQVITTQITKEIQHQSTFHWSIQQGINIKASVTTKGGIPKLYDKDTTNTTEIDLTESQGKITSDIDTFTFSYTLNIEPKTSVKAEWIIVEREVEVPWEADVYIDGWIAIWFHEKWEGHWLWFHPIYMLQNDLFKQNGDGLVFRAKGVFRGIRGMESSIRTNEYPIQPRDTQTGEPLSDPGTPDKTFTFPMDLRSN